MSMQAALLVSLHSRRLNQYFDPSLFRLRSYLGYPPLRDALPNATHLALAALQHTSVISRLITQNVDGLHHKALARVWDASRMKEGILELHGTLHVHRPTVTTVGDPTDTLAIPSGYAASAVTQSIGILFRTGFRRPTPSGKYMLKNQLTSREQIQTVMSVHDPESSRLC